MPLNKDFEELFHSLNALRAEYLVVGAYAVIFYTEPRYTKDIDIWVKPDEENAQKVYKALKHFGAPLKDLTIEDLADPRMIYQIGIEPNRIDILMDISGLEFENAWKNKKTSFYGSEKIFLLNLDDLIAAKKKAGRTRDLLDLESLVQLKRKGGKHQKK